MGLPVCVVVPLQTPARLRGHGILLKTCGPPEDLVPFALRHLTSFSVDELKDLCSALGVIPEENSDGNVNKPELEKALQAALDLDDASGDPSVGAEPDIDADLYEQGFEILDTQEQENFQELKEKIARRKRSREVEAEIQERARKKKKGATGPREHPTAEPRYRTPEGLKALIPGGGKLPGVALWENPIEQNFLGFYQGADPDTRRRTWGNTTNRTKEEARKLVLDWLQEQHVKRVELDAEIKKKEKEAAKAEKKEKKKTKDHYHVHVGEESGGV